MERRPKRYVHLQGSRFEVKADGLLYSPEKCERRKKEDCTACRFCQWCSDSRCALCRKGEEDEPRCSPGPVKDP